MVIGLKPFKLYVMNLRLIKITKPLVNNKRFRAIFEENGKNITTHFGSVSHTTFIDHKDSSIKQKFLENHHNNNNPTHETTLTKWILWGEHGTFSENLVAFKANFKL